jgi:hydroxymethylpyrimidine pyrophosphatase-like HAD family hydrolase
MDPIVIEPKGQSPRVYFDTDGTLLLEGRSIPEDVNKLFNPLIDFVQNLKQSNVTFDINLEYFNTVSSKKILELLKYLDANNKIDTALINWHYEADDEDSIEMAEIYEECLLKSEFRYVEHSESISLFDKKN